MLYQHLKLPEYAKIGAQYTGSNTFCMAETFKKHKKIDIIKIYEENF